MQINDTNLRQFFTALNLSFNKALANAQSYYRDVAMIVPSATSVEAYAWLTNIPGFRSGLGLASSIGWEVAGSILSTRRGKAPSLLAGTTLKMTDWASTRR